MNISLIIPCYNEETNIQKGVLDKVAHFVAMHSFFSEILIVDDGSTDTTKTIIKKQYLPDYRKMRLIENNHGGKAMALITGMKEAKSDWVLFSDIDLATPIEEAEKLIKEAQKGFEVVIGSRSAARQGAPLMRKIMAYGFILIRNIILGLHGIRDTQCGFKLFKKDVAITIIDNLKVFHGERKVTGSSVSAGFDLEFLFLAQKNKVKIKEVPVQWRHVETKNVRFFKDAIETMRDIIIIKKNELNGNYNK
jgi:glycosyltransferase involved in cell wall biosynthesis